MDQITHELRLNNWRAIIDSCQARPDGQTARQWLAENNVSEKQYRGVLQAPLKCGAVFGTWRRVLHLRFT